MREVKFRGKHAGAWFYGFLVKIGNGYGILHENGRRPVRVNCKSIGQYTGKTDSNGTEICEGDIVRTDDEDEELAIIEWGDDTLKFMVTHGNVCSDLGEYYPREIEVMGNIYDNPELIGGD